MTIPELFHLCSVPLFLKQMHHYVISHLIPEQQFLNNAVYVPICGQIQAEKLLFCHTETHSQQAVRGKAVSTLCRAWLPHRKEV